MTLQILVSTMFRNDYSLLDKMNIHADAVVVNQCEENSVKRFEHKGHSITWINSDLRGVGKSRNTAILASSADVLLFADDDVVYDDGAADKVLAYFESNPQTDLAVFNLPSLNPERPEPLVGKPYKLRYRNCLKFGAFRIAVRRESILKKNIFYSLLFGGGAPHKAGEDNLFITNCIQRGLNCFASDMQIGTVAQEQSTWFTGYDNKYYFDRGALFAAMYGRLAKPMLVLFEIRKPDKAMLSRLKTQFKGASSLSSR